MAHKSRPQSGAGGDALGKLIKVYRPSASAMLGVALAALLGGIGVLVYCQFQRPYPFKLMLLGIFFLAMTPVVLVINAFNFARCFQVRQHGVRFVDRNINTELYWDEIADVEVKRTEVAGLGVVTVWTKRSDLGASGLLTSRSEWEVLIHAHDGRTLRLSPNFLQHVPEVRSLVILVRKKAGLR